MKKGKKLVLNKETLRDLMAQNAGEVKGGGRTNGKKCATQGGVTCNTQMGCQTYNGCSATCWACSGYGCW